MLTQKVDREDPILGFFHTWIYKLSFKFEFIYVVCLWKGKLDLPGNVKVYSLGKELKFSIFNFQFSILKKIRYIFKFFNLCFFQSLSYDAVFVHMNQEYVLLGGIFWKIMRKMVFLWRNHPVGGVLTRLSVFLANKVFCTSEFAFVARYKKTSIMPVGIDTERFKDLKIEKSRNSILFLGRMSPIKKPDLLIDALNLLNQKDINFRCNFYGDPSPKDTDFYANLKAKARKLNLESKVIFHPGVPNYNAPTIYSEHNIFVNLTPTGSFDKTILEAAACGCLVVVTNESLKGEIDERMIIQDYSASELAEKIEFWLNADSAEKADASLKLQKYVFQNHSLNALMEKLAKAINYV